MGVTATITATFLFQESVALIETYFPYSFNEKNNNNINKSCFFSLLHVHSPYPPHEKCSRTTVSIMYTTSLLYSRRLKHLHVLYFNTQSCTPGIVYYPRTKWTNTLYSRLHSPSYLFETWPQFTIWKHNNNNNNNNERIKDNDNNTTITSPLTI